jgi:hypothetical protein
MPRALSDYRTSRWQFSRRAKFIFIPVFVLAFVNFASFWFIAVYIGGDAINGYAKDGHYFLASHGRFTEVSSAVWTYSYYHTISTWVTHASVFILLAIFLNTGDMAIKKS